MTQGTNAEQSFLMGGESVPSAFSRNDQAGTRRGGRITESPQLRQQTSFEDNTPLFWDDGNPRMHLVVTVQTEQRDPSRGDDDGRRRFYIKGNQQKAVRDAVQKAGAAGLEVGGTLFITRTGRDAPSNPKLDGAWLHSAEYTAAAANFVSADTSAEVPAQNTGQPPAGGGGGDAVDQATFPHLSAEQLAGVKAANLTADQVRQMFPAPVNA